MLKIRRSTLIAAPMAVALLPLTVAHAGGVNAGYGTAGVQITQLSVAGPDNATSAIPGPSGTTYVAGYAAPTALGTGQPFVVRLTATGATDTTWAAGTGGVATVPVDSGASVVYTAVQSTGKVLVAGTYPNSVNVADTDIFIARFTTAGLLDTTFGGAGTGIRRVDLSTATASVRDTARGLVVTSGDAIRIITTVKPADPVRIDSQLAVVGLIADGSATSVYGTSGVARADYVDGVDHVNETVRPGVLLADGSLAVAAYFAGSQVDALVFKFEPDGDLDPTFDGDGIVRTQLFGASGLTQPQDIDVQGSSLVLGGFGSATGAGPFDLFVARLTSTGGVDATFGASGVRVIDPFASDDRGREVDVLPDGRILLTGTTGTAPSTQDAVAALFTPNGTPDTSFGSSGALRADLGGGSDRAPGLAVSTDGATAVVSGTRAPQVSDPGTEDVATLGLDLTVPVPPVVIPPVLPPAKVTIASNALVENNKKTTLKLACSEGSGKCQGKVTIRSKSKVLIGQSRKKITVVATKGYSGDPTRLLKLKLKLTKDARAALADGAFQVVIEVKPAGGGKKIKKTVTLNP